MNWVGMFLTYKLSNRPPRGFTIVELLVVVVVIGILAAISVVAFGNVQQRARDAARLDDSKSVEKALRLYLTQTGALFGPTSTDGSWETSAEDASGQFMETLVTSGVVGKVPIDPQNSASRHYRYYVYPAGTSGCDAAKGQFAVFQIIELETSPRPYAQEPGFSCSGRNWSLEADYTVGIYQNG